MIDSLRRQLIGRAFKLQALRDCVSPMAIHLPPRRAIMFLLAVTMAPGSLTATEKEVKPTTPDANCVLCTAEPPVPIVPLSPLWLDSVATAHARFNSDRIAEIDSLFRAGCYGSPEDGEAASIAHLLARLITINAYQDLVRLAGDSTAIHESSGQALQEVNERYSDVILFPIIRLERVRLGLGRVCLRFDLDEKAKGETTHGYKHLKWRVKDEKLDGEERRVLSVDLPIGHDVVEVLLAEHHTYRVEHVLVDGPPASYECFLVDDIQGGWIRKWGTHRPQAYTFWATPTPTARLPEIPLVGLRLYVPGLRLRLPFFIPDINFDDLREVELPMPILEMEYLRHEPVPPWLREADALTFTDWGSYGPVPPLILERFPDQ